MASSSSSVASCRSFEHRKMAPGDKRPHLLIVHDDTIYLVFLRSLFMKHSCKVSSAKSELHALSLLGLVDDPHRSGNNPIPKVNMVIIDYDMQARGSVFELLKKIKHESSAIKDVPVVFVSDDDDVPSDSDKYIKAGAVMFINKPFMTLCAGMLKTTMLENMAAGN